MFLSLMKQSHDVKIKYIPGKDPTMIFLDAENKVVLVGLHYELINFLYIFFILYLFHFTKRQTAQNVDHDLVVQTVGAFSFSKRIDYFSVFMSSQ